MAHDAAAHRERRTARRATLPLTLMAVVFVLPTYRACGEAFERPTHFVDSPSSAFWVVPVFAVAALLALLSARAQLRGEMDRGTRRLALAALSALVLSSLVTALMVAGEDWPFAAAAAFAALIAGVVVRRARAMAPWQIWEHLLLAFAIAASGAGPTIILVSDLIGPSRGNLGPGAYVYLTSLATLFVVVVHGIARPSSRIQRVS